MKMRLWPVVFILLLGVSRSAWCAVKYSSEGSRDPFFEDADSAPVSLMPTTESAGSLVLDGILWSPQSGSARVNGQKVKAGDRIGSIEIIKVEKRGVRLRRDGEEGYLTKEGIQWT